MIGRQRFSTTGKEPSPSSYVDVLKDEVYDMRISSVRILEILMIAVIIVPMLLVPGFRPGDYAFFVVLGLASIIFIMPMVRRRRGAMVFAKELTSVGGMLGTLGYAMMGVVLYLEDRVFAKDTGFGTYGIAAFVGAIVLLCFEFAIRPKMTK